ncbi:MAG: class I SAM-dependent methyltransferase [Desertimonas sp.]
MSHYFDEDPVTGSAPTTVAVEVPGARFEMRTDRGVFSHGRLDAGTEVLLRHAPAPPASGTLLDLGCGAGPIALTLALRSPAATVWALDVNERARAVCAGNARRLDLTRVRIAAPEDFPGDVRIDAIWSNPPIRIGKPALHALLTTWLDRLRPSARAHLVVHKHLGSDSLHRWMVDQGWPVERIASVKGYRVLAVDARPEPASRPRRVDGETQP